MAAIRALRGGAVLSSKRSKSENRNPNFEIALILALLIEARERHGVFAVGAGQ